MNQIKIELYSRVGGTLFENFERNPIELVEMKTFIGKKRLRGG